MGAFRILLCWLVVAAHVDPSTSGAVRFAGPFALFSFFAVSGYYMTLTLTTTYAAPGGLRAYYANRFLRVVPLYLALLALCASLAFVNTNPTQEAWRGVNGASAAVSAVAQAIPLGQEAFTWMQVVDGSLAYTPSFHDAPRPAWHLLFMPTCWSLSLECWFYLFAPWLVRRSLWARAGIAALSLGLWGAVFAAKLPPDPWIYRLFPASLVFFMAGSIARTIHERNKNIVEAAAARPGPLGAAIGAFLALVVAHRLLAPRFPGPATVATLIPLYALAVAALPFMFAWSSGDGLRQRADRFLADLAYPIFLVHYAVLRLTDWKSPLAILAASAAIGAVALLAVDRPLARFKRRPVSASPPPAGPSSIEAGSREAPTRA